MFGFSGLFDNVFGLVQAWKPQGRYRDEDGYRNDLREFLRTNLNVPGFLGPQKRIKVTSESGRHLCDIAVDESVGIELKKNLDKLPEVDRLCGQLGRFKNSYPQGIIVVLVGNTKENAYEELLSRVDEMQRGTGISLGYTPSPKIKVVVKKVAETESRQEKGMYWVNPLTGKRERML